MSSEYKPRIIFEITEEQQRKADTYLCAHGVRKAIFSLLLDEVLELIETEGNIALGLLLSKAMSPSDILPSLRGAKNGLK